MESKCVIKLKKIKKSYTLRNEKINVLNDINLSFFTNKLYGIVGHSGSGKSTLIKIIGMIEESDNGQYELYGKNIKKYNNQEISNLRMKKIGFIFQNYYLNKNLKAYENIIVPMLINKDIEKKDRISLACSLLNEVGLLNRKDHFPKELSGGEQQRVAIARALANSPDIILADEPTGNLDKKNEKIIFSRLKELAQNGKCVIVVSHSDRINDYADEIYNIDEGECLKVKPNKEFDEK